MSFFQRLNHRRHKCDHLIFWLGLAVLVVVIYIFFFAPVKKLAPPAPELVPNPPALSTIEKLPEASQPPPPDVGAPTALPPCRAWISNSDETVRSRTTTPSFFPNEKIYLHVNFPQLAAGTARVNVNWISPAGKQSGAAEQVIAPVVAGPADVHFWLSLTPNGAVTALFSGKDYKRKAYGQWQARGFFNGEPLVTLPFLVHEN